jgi:hypothetical protein
MLSGVVAAWLLTMLYGQAPPSAAQFASAGLIVVALLFLSPLHHVRMYAGKLIDLLGRGRSRIGSQTPAIRQARK